MTARSHYETLGVADGAAPDEVRRAYLDLARQLHPDRWSDTDGTERDELDQRMRDVNEAWRVLGNPGRRLAYDAERRAAHRVTRTAPPGPVGEGYGFSTGELFHDDVDHPELLTRLVRALPWILLVGTLLGIFVFSAYATSGNGEAPEGEAGRCVITAAGAADPVPCDTEGARRVVREVVEIGLCPGGTEPFQPAVSNLALCLEPLP